MMSEANSHAGHDHKPQGFLNRWLFSTNHKDIGTLYLVFSLLMFLVGGAMAMIIRAELFQPGLQVVEPDFFNQMTTMHALVMIFGAVMPAFVGLVADSPDGGRAGHGVAPHEQLELLDPAFRLRDPAFHSVHGQRCPGLGLDVVSPAKHADGRLVRLRDLCHPFDGHQLHHGRHTSPPS